MLIFSLRSLLTLVSLSGVATYSLTNPDVTSAVVIVLATVMCLIGLFLIGISKHRFFDVLLAFLCVCYLVVADEGIFPNLERRLPIEWLLNQGVESHTVIHSGVVDMDNSPSLTKWAWHMCVEPNHKTSIAANVVLTQSNMTYNDAGQVLMSTSKDRLHDTTGNGTLNGPTGSAPKSRDSYGAMWYDGIGRSIATANYGTNGGTAPTRPASAPASSDTVLVSQTHYDIRGQAFESVDPAGSVTRQEFDDAGRTTTTFQNYVLRAELWSHFWPNCDCRDLGYFFGVLAELL